MSTKSTLLFSLFWLAVTLSSLPAQVTRLDIDPAAGCSYDGSRPKLDAVYAFEPSRQAEAVVADIMDLLGLPSNFTLKAANVPNAMAQVIRGQRYILYDEAFLARIHDQTGDYWAQVAILAHELGHHLSGHTLGAGGSRPELELEADQFSGFILYKLGATLEQAQSAVATLPDKRPSATHPPKSARLTAVTVGYQRAREKEADQPPTAGDDPGTPSGEAPPVHQITLGGKSYPTVRLNGLTWLAENLDYQVTDSWCYENDADYCRHYGRLYTWEAAKKACLKLGMRLPTDEEWREMIQAFGGIAEDATDDGNRAYRALIRSGAANFNAVLGGGRGWFSKFEYLGEAGNYWSLTERGDDQAWGYNFGGSSKSVSRKNYDKSIGLSCRCVRE